MIARETMTATTVDREREIRQLQRAREAERVARAPARERRGSWAWRVEPGMGKVFGSLRGWLLSRAAGGETEYMPSGMDPS